MVLTEAERTLVRRIPGLRSEYADRIKQADPGDAQITFTPDELDDLMWYITDEADRSKSQEKQDALGDIWRKIEDLLCEPYEIQPGKQGQKEPIVIDIPNYSPEPIGMEDEAVAYLHRFADQLEQSGADIDEILERMRPKQIGPDDRIGVSLQPAEREMLLSADLAEPIKEQIRQAPSKRRKLEFTLRQVNEIENAISKVMAGISDNKVRSKWRPLDDKFIEVQTTYAAGDEQQNSLGRLLSGESVSRGAAVRELLMKVLEERKATKAKPQRQRDGNA
ncbi:MAG: hypothetical protein NTW19_01330, partial [Planctomycetota bacterium]|nr:hypothetical protein [Planctomycetota bacterium]